MNWQIHYQTFWEHQNWKPHPFQEQCAQYVIKGYNGLLNAPTGSGKTYALAIPAIASSITNPQKGLKLLWISPLKALANDICKAIQEASNHMQAGWQVEIRNGDTELKLRAKQLIKPPDCLIITPESLHLLLATKKASQVLKTVNLVVVDEWHELVGSKRGIQVELALSRILGFNKKVLTWGISATIGNLLEAKNVLLPSRSKSKLIIAKFQKKFEIKTLYPTKLDQFGWAGHIGLSMIDQIIPVLQNNQTTLVFTNTRAMSEIWYHKILELCPQMAGQIAIHHGSLTTEIRHWVEEMLHQGQLKTVVCTSSLDLGVDFRPVDNVIQIGSPKGVARFVQRAGRSGHSPGQVSTIYFVPTNSLELIEAAALKDAISLGIVESKTPQANSFDVLIQYLVTLAVGEGFDPNKTFLQIKDTHAFMYMSLEEWEWILQFLVNGGNILDAYDEYKRVEIINGLYKVTSRKMAMRHRLNIGTIASDNSLLIKLIGKGALGSIEESFITRLNPNQVFVFAGRTLQLSRVEGNIAYVKKATASKGLIPSWMGGRMSLTSELSKLILKQIDQYKTSAYQEMKYLKPLFNTQNTISHMPSSNQLLVEFLQEEDGNHLFIYPFEGRMVNEGMAILLAYRIAKKTQLSFSVSMNDYGFSLYTDSLLDPYKLITHDLFSPKNLIFDLLNCNNYTQMTQKKFGEIAVISGMVIRNLPGKQIKQKHLNSTSSLIYKVLTEHDENNVLLKQAQSEVLYQQLEENRLRAALHKIEAQEIIIKTLSRPSPFCFGLIVDRLRETFSNESIENRIKKLVQQAQA